MSDLDNESSLIRQDFPVTQKTVYMNNGAIAPTPLSTIKAVTDFMLKCSIDGPDAPSTSEYILSMLNEVRTRVAHLINCERDEVVLLESTTQGLNLVSNGIDWDRGDSIVVRGGRHEHFANYFPWVAAAQRHGATLRELAVDSDGYFQMSELEKMAKGSRLITMSHALYNTGAIMPLEEVGKIANENNSLFCVDAAQSAGSIAIDVKKIGCHFMAFPGFKWLVGPLGIGVFYCSKGASEYLRPQTIGGESAILSDQKQINVLAPLEMPSRFSGGFRNYPGAAGMEASLRYILRIGIEKIRAKNMLVSDILRSEIQRMPGARVYGPDDPASRTSIVSFTLPSIAAGDLVKKLEGEGIILAERDAGTAGKVARAAPHFFNNEDEAVAVIRAIKRLAA